MKRKITTLYRRRIEGQEDGPEGGETPLYGEPVSFSASVVPGESALSPDVYGDRVRNMLVAYAVGSAPVQNGDGVCVHAGPDETPDYRAVSVLDWQNGPEIHLKRMGEDV